MHSIQCEWSMSMGDRSIVDGISDVWWCRQTLTERPTVYGSRLDAHIYMKVFIIIISCACIFVYIWAGWPLLNIQKEFAFGMEFRRYGHSKRIITVTRSVHPSCPSARRSFTHYIIMLGIIIVLNDAGGINGDGDDDDEGPHTHGIIIIMKHHTCSMQYE